MSTSAEPESAREVVSTRLLAYPRSLVFRAYTEPEHLAVWWGPKGFTNTFNEFDLRPGGEWRFMMHGPDGIDYPNHISFIEIVKPGRLVFQHLAAPHFHVTVTFEPVAKSTRVTYRMLFDTAKTRDQFKDIAVPANEENFDRLEAELARMAG